MPNVKIQMSIQAKNPNDKKKQFDILSFVIHLTFRF